MKLREAVQQSTLLAPGVFDAGLSSAAGFLTTLYAAKYLEPAELGVYGLYFSGFILMGLIPSLLYFVPIERASLEFPVDERTALVAPTSLTGMPFCAFAALIAPLPGFLALGEVPTSTILALGLTNAVLVFWSPLQDHVRLMHHFVETPLAAVAMSGAQLAVVIVTMAAMHIAGIAPTWIPFGALTLANICSTSLGLILLRRQDHVPVPQLPPFGSLIRLGGVLLVAEGLLAASILASESILLLMTSAETLGFAAAASAVARPVSVFSIGIGRVMSPRLMEAGLRRDRTGAWRSGTLYLGSLAVFTLVYVAAVGWPHDLNPMQRVIPTAYEETGLVAALAIGLAVHRFAVAPHWLLLGAERAREILWVSVGTTVVRLAGVALLAPVIGAYSLASGFLIEGAVRGGAGWKAAEPIFREEPD